MNEDRRLGLDPAGLIQAVAKHREKAAFVALFEFYAPRIKTMLMKTGAAGELAEDIAQETLLTIWRKAEYFDPSRASAAAWVYTIARNLRIDRLRREHRARQNAHFEMIEAEEPEQPDAALSGLQREECVRAALKQLSREQIRVVELSFFEGRPHGDIAELLGIPLGTVKSRLRLAMTRLREALGDLT